MSAKGYKFYTYIHIRNDIGEVFYVGKGTGRRAFALGRNPYWNSVVAKHGHTVHIVAYFANEADAFEHEREMIAELREAGFNLANMTDGGEGTSNPSPEVRAKLRNPSDETRAKISKAASNPSNETRTKMSVASKGHRRGLGRIHSQETRAKLSAASKGHSPSDETRVKISARNRERVFSDETRAKLRNPSDETRAKLSASHKGHSVSDETRAKISVAIKARNAKHTGATTV